MDRIGVFFGGKSQEHDISLLSAAAVLSAISKDNHEIVPIGITRNGEFFVTEASPDEIASGDWQRRGREMDIREIEELVDFCFPVLHGSYGEDGRIQGLFEMMDLPYAGSGVLSSALCMDKIAAKEVFLANHIATCRHVKTTSVEIEQDIEAVMDMTTRALPYPLFVKPANMGSSVGISKAKDREGLRAALLTAVKYDRRIIIEEGIIGRELELAVMGNDEPYASGAGEIVATHEFYDFDAKYSDDAGTRIIIPAEIDDQTLERMKEEAIKAYRALDCSGFARCDFLMEKATGNIYVSEINSIPGFTKYSMFPVLWQQEGVSFTEQIERIIEYGYERRNA